MVWISPQSVTTNPAPAANLVAVRISEWARRMRQYAVLRHDRTGKPCMILPHLPASSRCRVR
jgi:hypothetical protein